MEKEIYPEAKGYKPSKYNFLFDADDGTHLAFNAISGGFAKIDAKYFQAVSKILQGETIDSNSSLPSDIWNILREGNFIIDSEVDELDILKVINRVNRFANTILSLAIAPTLNCNFSCKYCYAQRNKKSMGENVVESLERFVEANSAKIKHLHIGWIGGEPLLCKDTIKYLSDKFITICHALNISYSSSIITNGFLLSPEAVQLLLQAKVNFVQVTIDGPPQVHNKRRPLATGGGSFDTIMMNLQAITKNTDKIKIGVRVNIDKENCHTALELIEIMRELGMENRILIEPAPVNADTPACKDISFTCLSPSLYYKKYEMQFIKKAIRNKFQINIRPYLLHSNCMAVAFNSFVVDPEGVLYKCWNDCGLNKAAIGFINNDGKCNLNMNLTKWLAWDPLELRKCKDCKFLPMCLGGCPYKKMHNIKSCTRWRYSLKENLNLLYEIFEKSKK